MKRSYRTHTTLLLTGALIIATSATAWWLTSPQSVRRTGEIIVLLVGCIHALDQRRRLPMHSPLPLCVGTVIGLAIALFGHRAGSLFPTVLALAAGVAWTCVLLGRYMKRHAPSVPAGTPASVHAELAIGEG